MKQLDSYGLISSGNSSHLKNYLLEGRKTLSILLLGNLILIYPEQAIVAK